MAANVSDQVLLGLVSWLLLAIVLGIVLGWCWALRRLWAHQPLLPERPLVPPRAISWGWTPLLVVVVYLAGNVLAFGGYALATRGVGMKRPAGHAEPPEAKTERADSGKSSQKPSRESRRNDRGKSAGHPGHPANASSSQVETDVTKISMTEMMFIQTAISAILLVLLPLVVRMSSGAGLRDLGLSFDGWKHQASVGVVAILILIPVVYAIQTVAVLLLALFEGRPRVHPVEKMLREQSSGGVAYLAFISAVIVAPVIEELIFRGILQRWLIGLLVRRKPAPLQDDPDDPFLPPPAAAAPSDPLYWEVEDGLPMMPKPLQPASAARPDIRAGVAIGLTSLCFAAVHGPQWPAPVALFVLAVAIGTVYHRTGSLIAAICMHAVFNGFSTLWLFLAMLGGLPAETDKTVPPPAIERNAPIGKDRHATTLDHLQSNQSKT
jgi:membrane protease YdiL (CAAX protease family)